MGSAARRRADCRPALDAPRRAGAADTRIADSLARRLPSIATRRPPAQPPSCHQASTCSAPSCHQASTCSAPLLPPGVYLLSPPLVDCHQASTCSAPLLAAPRRMQLSAVRPLGGPRAASTSLTLLGRGLGLYADELRGMPSLCAGEVIARHRLPSLALHYHCLPSLAIACYRFPSLAIDCHRLPLLAIACHCLPSLAIDCHRLPSHALPMYHLGLPSTPPRPTSRASPRASP